MYILRHKTCAAFGSKTTVLVALAVGFEAAAIDEEGMQLAVLDITDVFMAVAPVEVTADAVEVTTDAVELLAIQDDIVVAANELIAVFSFLAELAL